MRRGNYWRSRDPAPRTEVESRPLDHMPSGAVLSHTNSGRISDGVEWRIEIKKHSVLSAICGCGRMIKSITCGEIRLSESAAVIGKA